MLLGRQVLLLLPRPTLGATQPAVGPLPTAPPPCTVTRYCHLSACLQPGQYILWEDAPLDDSAKFYMVESGSVDCFRTFELGGGGEQAPVPAATVS